MYTSGRFTVYDSFQLKKRKFVVFDVIEVSFQYMVLYKRWLKIDVSGVAVVQ